MRGSTRYRAWVDFTTHAVVNSLPRDEQPREPPARSTERGRHRTRRTASWAVPGPLARIAAGAAIEPGTVAPFGQVLALLTPP